MSTPDRTLETSKLETMSREKQDDLTRRVGKPLERPPAKASWWTRMLRRG